VVFERHETLQRGEAGGADDHRDAGGDRLREGRDVARGGVSELREAPVTGHPHDTAVDHDSSPFGQRRTVECTTVPAAVDATNERGQAPNSTLEGGHHGVLEVHAAVVHRDEEVTRISRRGLDVLDFNRQGVIGFGDYERAHAATLRRTRMMASGRLP